MANLAYSEGPMTNEKCQLAAALKQNTELISLFVLEEVFAFVTLIGLWYLSRSYEFRRLIALLSQSLRTISTVGMCFYFICSIVNMIFYAYSIFLYLQVLPDCDYVWSNLVCHLVRYTTRYCSVGYTIFHVALLVERTNVAFGLWTTKKSSVFTGILTTFMLITPLLFVWITFRDEHIDGYQIYCFTGTKTAAQVMLVTKYILAIVDILSMIGDFALLAYNKYQLNRKAAKYNLKKSFELREMQISIKLIFPMTLIHTIALLPYFMLSSLSLRDSVLGQMHEYIIFMEYSMVAKAFYSAIIPPSVCILHRWTRSRRVENEWRSTINHADEHFQQLRLQFDIIPTKK